jgi:hypothetical protein
MMRRGRKRWWIVGGGTTVLVTAVAVIGVATGSARSGPAFAAGSASGDISRWRITFSETGLTPGSTVTYRATAKASATYICASGRQHFRVYRPALTLNLTAKADLHGAVTKGGSQLEGFVAPTCSDGSTPNLSSYGLYNVRILDTTHGIGSPSLRAHTTPVPR